MLSDPRVAADPARKPFLVGVVQLGSRDLPVDFVDAHALAAASGMIN
jgi:hypothetical protein